MKSTNCTTLECLRDAPTEVLLKANHDVIMLLVTGEIGAFGPAVDGNYVPDIPIRLLSQGKYHRELKSLISSNVGFEVCRPPTLHYSGTNTFPRPQFNTLPQTL